MKLFDPRAALAEIEKQAPTPATSATSATQTPKNPPNVANVADVAAPSAEISELKPAPAKAVSTDQMTDLRHGFALGDRQSPKTWTGKIVSLADWRQLSEWEKHGPDGRHWNGITKSWEWP